jgi:hypothetical protein
MPVTAIDFPLVHPSFFIADSIADNKTGKNQFSSSFIRKISKKLVFLCTSGDLSTFWGELKRGFKKLL